MEELEFMGLVKSVGDRGEKELTPEGLSMITESKASEGYQVVIDNVVYHIASTREEAEDELAKLKKDPRFVNHLDGEINTFRDYHMKIVEESKANENYTDFFSWEEIRVDGSSGLNKICNKCGKVFYIENEEGMKSHIIEHGITESKANEGKVKSYCNICGYDTWRNEGEGCPYHQRVLSDGTFLWDEFNQDGEAYDKYGNRNNETCPNCGNTEAPFLIDDEFCNNCYVKPPESKWEKYDRYTSYGISDEEARGDIWNESKASEGFDQGLYGHVDAKCKTCGVEFDSIPDMNDHYSMHSDHVSNLDDLDSNIPNSD